MHSDSTPYTESFSFCPVCFGEIYASDLGYLWHNDDGPLFCHVNCISRAVSDYASMLPAKQAASLSVDAFLISESDYKNRIVRCPQ